MSRTRTWEVFDELWSLAETCIPSSPRTEDQQYQRKPEAGRKPKYSHRQYFAAMVYGHL